MEKILVVDDEKDNLTILNVYLRQKGFEVITCDNGPAALTIAEKENPDLVILDIMMPEMDGFTVCSKLKKNERTNPIPVIFLTARYLDKQDMIQGLMLGAFDYITKPFDEGELFARINAALKIKHAEDTLKTQRDYLKTILNSVGHDLIIITPDFTIEMANDSFLKRRSLDAQSVLGKPCHQTSFFVPQDSSEECPAAKAFKGTPSKKVYEIKNPDPENNIYINISAFPIFNEKGVVERVVEIHQDITNEIQKENELRRMNILLENILLHMSEGLICIDETHRILVHNQKAEALVRSIGEIRHSKLVRIGDISIETLFNEHRLNKKNNIMDHTISGNEAFFKLNSTLVDSGKSQVMVITIDDITKELKTQEELIQSAKLVSMGELAAGIAHEINNPITGIIGYSELLNMYKDILPQKAVEISEKILKESLRVKTIVENLLKFSRRQQIMDMAYVDIAASMKEIVYLLAASFKDNNVDLQIDIPDNLPLVYCNSGLIQQAVLNLMQNSFDAITGAQKGTLVSLKISRDENNLALSIRDDGPGVPKEVREKIFEPFFTTKIKGKGTGLGLSLVHRIVKIHSGNILFNTSKEGTDFTITIPIKAPEIKKEEYKVDVPIGEELKYKNAIVVDDDPTVKEYLADILYTFKYKVDEASDIAAARDLISHNDYDIVILDVRLPDGDAFDLYYSILEAAPEKAARTVFITGDVSLDTKEKLKKTGKPFLIKPFSFNDLISIMGLK